jgi:hypothetical protein
VTPDFAALLLAAALAGLAGSGHCVAMCGGIAGALGLSSRAAAERTGRPWRFPLAYNLGRVASYAAAGALAGLAGALLGTLAEAELLRLAAQWLAGAVLLLIGIKLALGRDALPWLERAGLTLWRHIAPLLKPLLPIDTAPRAFAAGAIWGWMPCAMAYGMLLVAWMTTSAVAGAAIMAAFGLATMPALVLTGRLAAGAGRALADPRLRRAAGGALGLLGAATLLSPWLVHGAAAHDGLLGALACLPRIGG